MEIKKFYTNLHLTDRLQMEFNLAC